MFKKVLWIITLFLSFAVSLFGANYFTDKQKFIANQNRIATIELSGSGSMVVKSIQDTLAGETVAVIASTILIQAKGMDKLKMVMSSEAGEVSVMQYGGKKYQKSSGSDNVTVTPLSAPCDMYSSYFLFNLDPVSLTETVVSQEAVVEGSSTLMKYTISYETPLASGCDSPEPYSITTSLIWFDERGLVVKKEDYAGADLKRVVECSYSQVGEIFIASTMVTRQIEGGMVLESSISYAQIQVNEILEDTVFQL